MKARRRRRLTHTRRILLLAGSAMLPAAAGAVALAFAIPLSSGLRWTIVAGVLLVGWGALAALHEAVVHPLQTLGNLTGALREGDFSFRARTDGSDDPLNLAFMELNALAATLREERLEALEATALLRKVLAEIDVAVLAFDASRKLRLTNRAGERLLGLPSERLVGLSAEELGLADLLRGGAPRVVDLPLPGVSGRFEARHGIVRQGGRPVDLLVLSDVSRALREEERQAWRRLIRVLSHEINNSLTPIQSIAGTLQGMVEREPLPGELGEDLGQGLEIIAARSRSLARFMAEYARLARLPAPVLEPLPVGDWVRHGAGLETRLPVQVLAGPAVLVPADRDQLDQALINLLRNAADAALETGGGVRVGWSVDGDSVEIRVEDDGPGLPPTANLFVPFFTTKPSGTGIGLALSRQIAEAHGGELTLENRVAARGCVARLRLPLRPAA
jgi:nitrogen fixation/metabolism regulation signal transduction histidine kinase